MIINNKYGFVYIWYDRKRKMFYIGSHWGTEDDGYICSSPWMKAAYKKRPEDFKRRVILRIYTNRKDLLIEEDRWLSYIQPNKIGIKYYNLHLTTKNLYHGLPDADKIYEKIRIQNLGRKQPREEIENRRKSLKKAFNERHEKMRPDMEKLLGDFSRGMKLSEVSVKYGLSKHLIRKYVREEGIFDIKSLFPESKTKKYKNRIKMTKEEQKITISKKLKQRWATEEGRVKLLESYKKRPSSLKKKDRENFPGL